MAFYEYAFACPHCESTNFSERNCLDTLKTGYDIFYHCDNCGGEFDDHDGVNIPTNVDFAAQHEDGEKRYFLALGVYNEEY